MSDCGLAAYGADCDAVEVNYPPGEVIRSCTNALTGRAYPLINGRFFNGTEMVTEPLDQMQTTVQGLQCGDFVYLAAWSFVPSTNLNAELATGNYKDTRTWGELLKKKATDGVKIRILFNEFDPIDKDMANSLKSSLNKLDNIIKEMNADKRDNLKYIVHRQPVRVGRFRSGFAIKEFRETYVGSHHQKFMVTWSSQTNTMVAFCGGVDIAPARTPAEWYPNSHLYGWHDIHVRLEGPITRDIEREFVTQWNSSRDDSSRRSPLAGWNPMEKLYPTALSTTDDLASKKVHKLRVLKTVSNDGVILHSNQQADIKNAYKNAIQNAEEFIYIENQYVRSIELGNWIVQQGKRHPTLAVIIVVVADAAADDGENILTAHGNHLQFRTFDLIKKELGNRARIYTMDGRAVHSKFMLIDDKWMTIGSANANDRSFELDTELNIEIEEAALTKDFRVQLWARNLGKTPDETRHWKPQDFIHNWDLVANANSPINQELKDELEKLKKDMKDVLKDMKDVKLAKEAAKKKAQVDNDYKDLLALEAREIENNNKKNDINIKARIVYEKIRQNFKRMGGASVIHMDYTQVPGKEFPGIHDELVKSDAPPDNHTFTGIASPNGTKIV